MSWRSQDAWISYRPRCVGADDEDAAGRFDDGDDGEAVDRQDAVDQESGASRSPRRRQAPQLDSWGRRRLRHFERGKRSYPPSPISGS